MLRSLLKYSKNITKITPDYDPDLTTPIMIVRGFNGNVSQDHSLSGFMLSEFNLSCTETSLTTFESPPKEGLRGILIRGPLRTSYVSAQDINKEEFQLERVRLQAFVAVTEPGYRNNSLGPALWVY
ncbi:hypothetical protein TNCV_3728841 [Trichonephila clavipes]|nr:hypothetical protein TNCV_3728841 [Trichonephila clavipes]